MSTQKIIMGELLYGGGLVVRSGRRRRGPIRERPRARAMNQGTLHLRILEQKQ